MSSEETNGAFLHALRPRYTLRVLQGTYGVLSNPHRQQDVTESLQKIAESQGEDCLFLPDASKNFLPGFRDKAVLVSKQLRIVFRESWGTGADESKTRTCVFDERDDVRIVAGTFEDELQIVRASYGHLSSGNTIDVTDAFQLIVHQQRMQRPVTTGGVTVPLLDITGGSLKCSLPGFGGASILSTLSARIGMFAVPHGEGPLELRVQYCIDGGDLQSVVVGDAEPLQILRRSATDAGLHAQASADNVEPAEVGPGILSPRPRGVGIVTTASLPWLTGTAVNPLFRAVYLARHGHPVTLLLPYLPTPDDQARVFPVGLRFATMQEQREYIYSWIASQCGEDGMDWGCGWAKAPGQVVAGGSLRIAFYRAEYSTVMCSVFMASVGGWWLLSEFLKRAGCDAVVLEEPEHLMWFHPHFSWKDSFGFVLGVVHTNYESYLTGKQLPPQTQPLQPLLAAPITVYTLARYSAFAVDRNCHRVIRLSGAIPEKAYPGSAICNINGVSPHFLLHSLLQQPPLPPLRVSVEPTASAPSDSSSEPKTRVVVELAPVASASGNDNDETSSPAKIIVESKAATVKEEVAEGEATTSASRTDGPSTFTITPRESSAVDAQGQCYFVGKLVWAKGLREVFDLVTDVTLFAREDSPLAGLRGLDIYGDGPDAVSMQEYVTATADRRHCSIRFCGPMHHDDPRRRTYKVFVNPSVSEVLCTTTAEALALGQRVVIPYHPSNFFFSTFPNCLSYESQQPRDFADKLATALCSTAAHDHALTEESRRLLSWDAATHRLLHFFPPAWNPM